MTAATPLFDVVQAKLHTSLLGITTPYFRSISWNGGGAVDVTAADPDCTERLEQLQQQGHRLYLIAGGARKDDEVGSVPALFAEWDGFDTPEEAEDWLHELHANGLPDPTLRLNTWEYGSLHVWWRLDQPCTDIARWRALMDRLVVALGSDATCVNPSQLMRLAGGSYIATTKHGDRAGQNLGQARIRHADEDATTTIEEMEAWVAKEFVRRPELQAILKEDQVARLRGIENAAEPPTDAQRLKLRKEQGFMGNSLLPPRTLAEIKATLDAIPRRVSGLPDDDPWRYPAHRFVLVGLRDALYRLSGDKASATQQAIELMEAHSPSKECSWKIPQVLRSSLWLDEGCFWNAGRKAGVDLKLAPAPTNNGSGNGHAPVSSVTAAVTGTQDTTSPQPAGLGAGESRSKVSEEDRELIADEMQRIRVGQRAAEDILSVLPPGLSERFKARADSFPTAPEMLLPPFMAITTSIYGKRGKVVVKGTHKEPLIVWSGTVAAPSAMKTPVDKAIMAPLMVIYDEKRAGFEAECARLQAEAERDKERLMELKEKEKKKQQGAWTQEDADELENLKVKIPVTPSLREFFVTQDCSFEQLGQICSRENVRGLAMELDELESWLKELDEKPKLRPKWLQLWSGGYIKQDYKTTLSAYVSSTCISIFGNTTPDNIASRIAIEAKRAELAGASGGTGDGMWPRMLWCRPPHVAPYSTDLDVDISSDLLELYRRIDAIGEGDITLTPEASLYLIVAHDELVAEGEGNSSPVRKVFIGKLRGYLYRFAGWLSIIDRAWLQEPFMGVTRDQAARAHRLALYFLGQFDQLAPLLGRSIIPDWVEKLRQAAEGAGGSISARDFGRNHGWKTAEAKVLLQEMVEVYGQGRLEEGQQGRLIWHLA